MKERPSNLMMQFLEKERHLATQELDLLDQSAAVENTAREMKRDLDQVRAALRSLSGTGGQAEAEVLFLELAATNVPSHAASKETTLALDQRRKTISARRKALLAEATAMATRQERMAEIASLVANAKDRAADIVARHAEQLASQNRPTEPGAPEASSSVAAPETVEAPVQQWQKPRAHKRVEIERMVTLTSQAGTLVGFCRNLSVGGMLLSTYDKLLPAGTPVEVMLTLSGRSVRIPATVRYAKKSGDTVGMGLDFGDASPEIEVALYAFLNELGTDFWERDE